ncbi:MULTISPECIES: MarR family winged helix-turn-helix transcriptional regulator [unclassified Cryobacterium]|uniref:MarR family winged helix-turn-helix transcriptional regulator n=1 Tax=unclassified Cryobacterium TaxID=2649013 RepID=UPI001068F932|nr:MULTISPECIES: MarR family transcriptional regulator [unclassified Cryobacterium]TFC50313.1 MarR family transcriptional regulator [Cryobacterium sp. TMB3-1-2]TFC71953.1 MarR family transcriptional regulator [Cryobacterium sp. TMB3-15]TFC78546.1 MarR family transcriptional regulator [Cryobacterium sp. TMB3-10]TFD44603.1 MarR family transcriptional regulator [Cryobacterium sp. TMB3-12]
MHASLPTSPTDAAAQIDWTSNGIETELGWSLALMFHGYSRAGSVAVADVPGGPRGYQVLVAVTTEEPTSQLALAHRLGIDKTAMTYIIDALETDALVERRPGLRDRRVRQVHPTEAGHALLRTARVALRTVEGALMGGLSTDEQNQLRQLLAKAALGAGATPASLPDTNSDLNLPVPAPERSRRRPQTTTETETRP